MLLRGILIVLAAAIIVSEHARAADVSCLGLALRDRLSSGIAPADWGLDASGADLLKSIPEVATADYRSNLAAVIDSGLATDRNPLAGNLGNRDFEYGFHGTAASGVIGSTIGVNPRAQVKVYALSQGTQTRGRPGSGDPGPAFKSVEIAAALRKAALDPNVAVINMSLQFFDTPMIVEAVRAARAAGKWVVYAAGNAGKLNDAGKNGLSHFSDDPGIFVSGALSYFAAPASFSNHDTPGMFYSPGTDILTLNADYDPAIIGSKPTVEMSGTSFSAPHLSAILVTMRAVHPGLTPEDARMILVATALRRGTRNPILQVNDYLAVRATAKIRALRESGACSGLGKCFELAMTDIDSEARALLQSASKPGRSMAAQLSDLKKGFFLSRGDEAFAMRIIVLLARTGERGAPLAYFSDSNLAPKLVGAMTADGRAASQLAPALKFLAGELGIEPLLARFPDLERIPAKLEFVPLFAATMERDLASGRGAEVRAYLDDAPSDFILALGKLISESKDPSRAVPFKLVVRFDEVAKSPEDGRVETELLARAARTWGVRADLEDLAVLPSLAPMRLVDRQTLLAGFEQALRNGRLGRKPDVDQARFWLMAWSKPELTPAEHALLVDHYRKSANPTAPRHRLIGELYLTARRRAAGFATSKEVDGALRAVMTELRGRVARQDLIIDVRDRSDDAVLTNAMVSLLRSEKEADQIGELLLEPGNLAVLSKFVLEERFLSALLRSVSERLEEPLLERALADWRQRGVKAAQIADFFEATATVPTVKRRLERIADPVVGDEFGAAINRELMRRRALASGGADSRWARALMRSTNHATEPSSDVVLALSQTNVARNPTYRERFLDLIANPLAPGHSTDAVLNWLSFARREEMRILAAPWLEHIDVIIASAKAWPKASSARLGRTWASAWGEDPAAMARILGSLERLMGWGAATPEARTSASVLVIRLAQSRAGAAWLERNPALLDQVATHISSSKILVVDETDPLPPALEKALVSRFPDLPGLQKDGTVAGWIVRVIVEGNQGFKRAQSWLELPEAGANLEIALQVADALRRAADSHASLIPEYLEWRKNKTSHLPSRVRDRLIQAPAEPLRPPTAAYDWR